MTAGTGPGSTRTAFYRVQRVLWRLNRLFLWLSMAAIGVMLLATLVGVLSRYVFREPQVWSYPVSAYLLLYVTFLAAAETLARDEHVRGDFFLDLLPPHLERVVRHLARLLGGLAVVVLTSQVWTYAERAIRNGERDSSMLGVPLVYVVSAMPLGMVLLTLTYAVLIVEGFIGRDPTLQRPEGDLLSRVLGE